MIANESATLFISKLGPCISNMSQFKTYSLLFISNYLHNCLTFINDGSDIGLQLSVTSNGELVIELIECMLYNRVMRERHYIYCRCSQQ